MANQAPTHPAPAHPKDGPQKADPALAQYTINLTPEQYEARLKAAKDVSAPRLQMEMGGSGTAKVHFHDATGADIETAPAEWAATGPVTVTPDEADPTSAKLVPTGLGPATVTATVNGSVQAHAELMVIEKIGAPVGGTIEIVVQPPTPPEPPPITQVAAAPKAAATPAAPHAPPPGTRPA